ncbi:MAG: glycosyltransferase, partial [Candidatus Margulisiibacteriota bacterium]
MKVAIVHDFLFQFGGAEQVVATLHEMFPDAPIFTSIYFKDKLPTNFAEMDIRPSSLMQNIPFIRRTHKHLFFLYPLIFQRIDLADFDLIISSSSSFAKNIKKPKSAKHVCYCHNPARFIYKNDDYLKKYKMPFFYKKLIKMFLPFLRSKDVNNDQVDYFIANSKRTAAEIKKRYHRDSEVIYPPIDTGIFNPSGKKEEYFVTLGRLVPYKRYDIVIEAFNRLGLPLKVIGAGPALKELKEVSKANIQFLGYLPEKDVTAYLSGAKALIWPEESDFGMSPVEAAACGTPCVAFSRGGAAESIVEGVTGVFFDEQTPEALIKAINKFQSIKFDPNILRKHAIDKFDKTLFKKRFMEFLAKNNIDVGNRA